MLAIIVTLLVVLAVLTMLLMNIACTGMFFNDRPQGDRAMGLVIPLFGLAGAILVLTFAALLAAFRVNTSAVGAITSSPVLAGVLVVVLAFGAALAAGMAFMLWCEPAAVSKPLKVATIPVGIILGVCGPVILAVMMLVGVWMSKSAAAAALESPGGSGLGLKVGFVAVCLLAGAGYGLGGSMFWKEIERRAANRFAALAEVLKDQARWQAEERKSPKQRLTDELAGFSPDAPLWTVIAYLPDQPDAAKLDDECRDIVMQRALQVSNLDAELADCMRSRYYLYRQAASEFLVSAPDAEFAGRRDAWGRALLIGLEGTGDGICCRPAWLSETFDSKPDPLGHVRSLLKAADRFKDWSEHAEIRRRLQKMADDAGMLNADSSRDKLLKMLADSGYRASAVRPAPSR